MQKDVGDVHLAKIRCQFALGVDLVEAHVPFEQIVVYQFDLKFKKIYI